jgi:hypothetical protein
MADLNILPPSPPQPDKRHPTGLELWLKCTRAIVTRSTLDTTATIKRTHERLQHFFRHRRLKKSTTPLAVSPEASTR